MRDFRNAAAVLFAFFAAAAALAQNPSVTIAVDLNAGRHPISPYIYGVAFADTATLLDLNFAAHRYGGNNTSRYNWQLNADNRGADWYFESIGDNSATAAERTDSFISDTKAAGAEAMITVPMLDWVARLGANRAKLASFSQAKYGAQTDADWSWFPDAGNGVLNAGGQNIAGNDPNDANVPNNAALQSAFAQHTVSRWGTAGNGGLRYYLMDNEHSIWFSTHRDVAPAGATMDQIRQKMIDYASVIKAADPGAKIVGPEEWGWSGYLLSGYDQQYGAIHGWGSLPDRQAHGSQDYLPWLLGQLHQYEVQNGQRLLDVFSLHYYPQGGEFGNDTSSAMQLTRNRSTRSLWDPNYTDTSWINDKVMLIPRMKQWVASYYPGLQTAITEYNWGAENHINGATAQADILGIFGREGLDFAARWTTPAATTPTYKAMKLFRNYDGSRSAFGETSVQAAAPNPDQLSAFAAQRTSDGALTLLVVNKVLSGNTPIQATLANFTGRGSAQVWQLTSANAIAHLADLSLSGATLNATVPPQSVTLFVIPAAPATVQRAYVSAITGNDANTASGCPATAPCRWFQTAAGVVSPNGEVVALHSGAYGAVTLTQSISLTAAPGVYAGITAFSGNAVTIATPGVAAVLRGLTLNGLGGAHGVEMSSGARLSVENCVIANFSGAGLYVHAPASVRIVDTLVRDSYRGAELIDGAAASISGSKFLGNTMNGILVGGSASGTNTTASISDSVVMGSGTDWGISAQSLAATATVRVEVVRSAVSKSLAGVVANSTAGGAASVVLSRSRVTGNGTALSQGGAGAALNTLGNNAVADNAANTSGTITLLPPM